MNAADRAHLATLEARLAQGPRKFHVGGAVGIIRPDGSVTPLAGGLPVSRFLPPVTRDQIKGRVVRYGQSVFETKDGGYCDGWGRRIVASNRDAEHVERATGFKRVRDDG